MGKNSNISQYRERLDKTLASPELTNPDALKTRVRNLLQCSALKEIGGCSENVVQKRTDQVLHFLDMLRSASINENRASKTTEASHGEWKLKDDNEEYRVMYREGPQGTPFHTLLVEGYVNGPVDACLCISWETTLFKKWWPHFSFPPFKIIKCEYLQKVRIGEQISLVRVRVTWPLSAREAVVHFFLFEYLEDGLVLVLTNTISDVEGIDKTTHGFTREGIPEAKEVVRIDVVGGFAIQKVTSERSYFRTIATMDMKLDFVPPSLINFISRQLIGSGFRLYQKVVSSVSNYDEDYSKALEDPMYARIREALYSTDKRNETVEEIAVNGNICLSPSEHSIKTMKENMGDTEQNVGEKNYASEFVAENVQVINKKAFGEIEVEDPGHVKDEHKIMKHEVHGNDKDHATESLQDNPATNRKAFGEIEEEESHSGGHLKNVREAISRPSIHKSAQKRLENRKRNAAISPDVEQALETLEKAIYMVREYGFNVQASSSPVLLSEEPPDLKKGAENHGTSTNFEKVSQNDSIPVENGGVCSNGGVSLEVSEKGELKRASCGSCNSSTSIRPAGSNSLSKEVNHNKIAPASPEECLLVPGESNMFVTCSSPDERKGKGDAPNMDLTMQYDKHSRDGVVGVEDNGLHEDGKPVWQKKHRFCCFVINSGNW